MFELTIIQTNQKIVVTPIRSVTAVAATANTISALSTCMIHPAFNYDGSWADD
jgi:hypothetical protein